VPPLLFTPLTLRSITLKNRIAVSPMCEYSSHNGYANDWHLVHLGSRAIGGAGLVFTEASAVTPEGRISPDDLGIYEEGHLEMLSRIAHFIEDHGSVPGIQLAHAGRKGSTASPWKGGKEVTQENGGWQTIAPSAIPFAEGYPTPREMSLEDIEQIPHAFEQATQRTLRAGFKIIELHAAHGYLLHQFHSPLSNRRNDEYGGEIDNRIRLTKEVVTAIRKTWPAELPLVVRISATDWVEGGWDIDDSIILAKQLKQLGVDLIDCSSGGSSPHAKIQLGPGYQTPFAEHVKHEAQIKTGAVGLITSPEQAEHILQTEQADIILLARELLRDPYWPRRAAKALGFEIEPPNQYRRAW